MNQMALAGALSGFFSFIFRPGKKLDVSNLNNEWLYARKLCDTVNSVVMYERSRSNTST